MLWTILSYAPVITCLYIVGTLTIIKDFRRPTNVRFALFTFALATWLLALFIADFVLKADVSLWALRSGSVFGTLIGPLFLLFCTSFPMSSRRFGNQLGIWYLVPSIFFVGLSLTPLIIPGVEIRDSSAQVTDAGLLYSLQSLYIVGGFVIGIVVLLGKLRYKGITPKQKSQLLLVISGITVAIAINIITNVVLILLDKGSNYSNFISTLSFLVFASATAYAIVRHQLFDMRLAIMRTVGFIITVGIVSTLYSLLVVGISEAIVTKGGVSPLKNSQDLLLLIPPAILIALTFNTIRSIIARATRRVFYHDAYDLRITLDTLSDTLVAANEVDDIIQRSLTVIAEAIKPSHSYFAVFNDQAQPYHELAIDRKPPRSTKGLVLAAQEFSDNPIVRDTIYDRKVPEVFEKEDAAIILLLGGREAPTALILFGPKQNGSMYTTTDIDVLRIGAKNLEVALENAKKYEQISHFADTLREEVDHATEKLRRANSRLKTLDALKDDFMSMASHQLRSPATSVHEALRMLNNPEVGAKDRDDLIALAEANSERLVTVVKTMLDMARLQSGRFTVDRSDEDIVGLARKVILQSGVVAEARSTKLIFKKPAHPVKALVDAAKIAEAMANYVENAIKYSPKKSRVEVDLRIEDEKIIFEVLDEGMGVPAKERENLFGKFYRAVNARTEEPDGNGIGLYVVRNIAQKHGGEAYYKPRQPQGSVFGFWIPLKRSAGSIERG